jgi:hypothetical protein
MDPDPDCQVELFLTNRTLKCNTEQKILQNLHNFRSSLLLIKLPRKTAHVCTFNTKYFLLEGQWTEDTCFLRKYTWRHVQNVLYNGNTGKILCMPLTTPSSHICTFPGVKVPYSKIALKGIVSRYELFFVKGRSNQKSTFWMSVDGFHYF